MSHDFPCGFTLSSSESELTTKGKTDRGCSSSLLVVVVRTRAGVTVTQVSTTEKLGPALLQLLRDAAELLLSFLGISESAGGSALGWSLGTQHFATQT